MRDREHAVDSGLVLDCIEHSALSAYDCEFVALAQQLQITLVTADRAIVKAFPMIARPLI
jgi:predicted nucleic acid-binding protein